MHLVIYSPFKVQEKGCPLLISRELLTIESGNAIKTHHARPAFQIGGVSQMNSNDDQSLGRIESETNPSNPLLAESQGKLKSGSKNIFLF
jgi:hypothetical protein